MDGWGDLAVDLLAAAVASGVAVDRAYVAPGPVFARDCRAIVVYLDGFGVRPLQRGDFTGTCAVVPQARFMVVFNADCVPTVDDSKRPIKLPTPDEITAWATTFGNDAAAVFAAVLGWAPGGDCSRVTIGDGFPQGPLGGQAEVRWPVTISLLG